MSIKTSARRPVEQPPLMNFSIPQNETYQTKILGFSGKQGAGKDTLSNFIVGLALCHVVADDHGKSLVRSFDLDADGKLLVDFGEGLTRWDIDSRQLDEVHYRTWPFIKVYSFATPIKEFCNIVLNVDEKLLWGTQEEKKGLTSIRWDSLPGNVSENLTKTNEVYLTGRELMEYFGTNVVRKMFNDAWAQALMKIIKNERPVYAIVKDVRFLNENAAIESAGGSVIRLNKVTEQASQNQHVSNCELDNFDFKYLLKNHDQDRLDTFNELTQLLIDIGWFAMVNQ